MLRYLSVISYQLSVISSLTDNSKKHPSSRFLTVETCHFTIKKLLYPNEKPI
ncbi:hypothetical protein [Microcystis panniformis]|uniref:Uncharacterized protein n=1 Tax=Microcystis panniformis FACHB-1757 TaxID=1638788 RepID=A0A0K1SAS2_9CHRO|nr:hypothetical protein [Microcystis panniformis]AKV71145.1 hypothetical protein VL20_6411 [Microcystis panniformis FACHB-1757]